MRRTHRVAAPLAALLLGLACGVSSPPVAVAEPAPPGSQEPGSRAFPSQARVDDARARAVRKAEDVSAISTRLLLADQRLEAAGLRAEQASETYNGALWRLQQARSAHRAARRDADRAGRAVAAQRDRMGALVAQSYQNGGDLSALTAMVGADGLEGVLNQYAAFQGASTSLRADYQRFTASDSLARVFEGQARRAKAKQARMAAAAGAAQVAAASAAQAARDEATSVAAQKAGLLRALAQAQHVSVALAGQRQAALVEVARARAAERARRAALEAAEAADPAEARAEPGPASRPGSPAAAPTPGPAPGPASSPTATPTSTPTPDRTPDRTPDQAPDPTAAPLPTTPTPAPEPAPAPTAAPEPAPTSTPDPTPVTPPQPGGGAAAAIRFAEAQLGEPYRWGAAGPGSWDCSGLTMAAWGSAGTSLPHYSAAQYDAGVPVSVTDLQPGDLVFWSSNGRPSGIHHVALYYRDGQIIHAPRTGRPVAIDDLYYWVPPTFFVRV